MRRLMLLSLLMILARVSQSSAHYNMLLPESWSAKKAEPVKFTYQWGHPFEHQLFDAPAPEKVVVIAPDGNTSEITKTLEKITVPSGDQKVTAYRFKLTPDQRGDYVIMLWTPPIWMKDENEFWQDTVKVVLHVQAQKGWDHDFESGLQWSPVTRPYGLQPGMVFQAKLVEPEIGPRPRVRYYEIERYNAVTPKTLPPDEQITRTGKTEPPDVATCTLTEPGWWCLTASRVRGTKERDGKKFPIRERSTFWVYVDEKPPK